MTFMRLLHSRPARLAALASLLLTGPLSPELLHAQDQKGLSLDSLLSTPVSSASKRIQSVREAPASVTIISAEEIELYGWTDLGQLLNAVGGFYSSYDRNYTYLGVRGFGRPTDYNNRLLLLLNGHTLNEGIWGSTAVGPDLGLDLRSLARVEVVRGPGSVLYGNNALFAVINLVTKDGTTLDGVQAFGSAGSYGNRGGSLMAGTQLGSGLDLVATSLYGETDGQTLFFPELADDAATGGRIRDLDWEKRGSVFLRVKHAPSGLWAMARYANRRKGIPTAAFSQIPGAPGAATLDRWGDLELGLNRALSPSIELTARGYANYYRYEGDYEYAPLYREQAINRVVGGEANVRLDFDARHRTTVGTELRDNIEARYRTPRSGPATLTYGDPYRLWSGFLQHEMELGEHLTIVAGARYDHDSRFDGRLTPRGALVVHPDRLTSVKLLYGEAFRAPAISEAANGGVAAEGLWLEPEEIRTLEVIVQRQAARGLLITAGAFQYRVNDLIGQVLDPVDSVYVFRNIDRAVAKGLYGGFEWQNGSGSHASVMATLSDADNDETGEHLTNSPHLLLKVGAGVALPASFSIGVQSRYESSRWTIAGTETDNLVVTDAYLRWRSRTRPGFEAGLRINNLFNTDWSTPGGTQHLMPAIQQDGRNILLTVGVGF